MFEPKDKDRNERQNAPEPTNESKTEPKKGGFGAFADKYRERWEAEHPKTDKPGKEPSATGGTAEEDQNPTRRPDRTSKP
jgi:hypothetical protein